MKRIETARGPIEYLVEGTGAPILYFHGTPCSSRVAADLESALVRDGFQLIVPHRPGYFGTPLAGRLSTADCAEVARCLLDELGIERVAVMGTSGGGPPALAFAARYPQRTAALVLQCAQSHRWDDARWGPKSHPWLYHCFRNSWSRWFFCRFYPTLFRLGIPTADHYLRDLTGSRYPNVCDEPGAREFAEAVQAGIAEFPPMRAGFANDLATWLNEDVLSSASVTCPTLLLYDPEDPQAPICHAHHVASSVPGAELVELNAGGHLLWFGPDAPRMIEKRAEFLRRHLGFNPN
jgi:pimeloyl-ACP methyl ester carboxylesterase